MSGPFRFQQEDARSPLDRSASPFSPGQPVSFKTNVNRAKTKKWVQAKKNAYDGDDWGGYDEYDEYGVNQEPEQPQPPAQQYHAQQSRSFTDPSQQAPLLRGRRNSFEHGEEQRAFSSTILQPHHGYGQQDGEPRGQASGHDRDQAYDMGDRGGFSPSAMPPPLQTRISQVPADYPPPTNPQFPPRKSSIGQGDMPISTSPRSRNASQQSDKPLPFIRPADIYKRHQEERERASMESSRPSLDSLSSPTRDDMKSTHEGGRSPQPMQTVAERKSDYDAAAPHPDKQQPQQQDRSRVSPQDDQELRSVVDQAFTRADESRSVPPTPISNDNDSGSDLLRSNTGSTAGISPIMSRVPSSAASALRNRDQAESNTPAIAEEPSETMTLVTQPTSANVVEPIHHVPRRTSLGHSRNFSNSSLPRSGLATPTRGDSPARSPVLTPSRDVPEPKSALVTTESNETTNAMEGGSQDPSSVYATREADIATAARAGPDSGAPELGATELQSQHTFLESHNAQSPVDDVLPRDRSESPSKGRVQALAGKFGEVASSRRGSTQSNRSRNSVQSWERSNDNSRAGSPTKASPSKPNSPVKEFRPHLPGQWESYATTPMTPSDQGEQDGRSCPANNGPNPHNESDLTPTTDTQPFAGASSAETDSTNPIAALRDAGAAMVNSLRTTFVAADDMSETQQHQARRTDHGNIYLPRPLQLDRTGTSTSSVPPTPPAKDTLESEFPPPPPSKDRSPKSFNSQTKPPSLDPQLSTDPSGEDQESDRLRKEIVASLSPFKVPASPVSGSHRASLHRVSPGTNRASSILPSEYDTYWADEDRASRRSSQDTERHAQGQQSGATVLLLPQAEEPTKPVILDRFSWDASKSQSQSQTPDEQAQGVSTAELTKALQANGNPPHTVERATDQERQELSEGLPDSHFGPDHTFTITKPDPISDTDMPQRPVTPTLDTKRSVSSPIEEKIRSPGLHVVNTELNPEAVDLPSRFSAEHEQPLGSGEPGLKEKQQPEQPAQHPAILSYDEKPNTPIPEPLSKSPIMDKPLGAREIATLNTAAERIDTYNKTREYWTKVDHGLNDWLHSALEANPDLATQTFSVQRVPTSSARHRHTGSLALFGKLGGSSSHDVSADQHNNASVLALANSGSPTTATPSGSGFGGRIANQQMQLKGKDLLHTANVLGGKGMTSAKGLFAKGKSRFGREKIPSHARADSAPSSREASEEPELVTQRSRASSGTQLIRSMTERQKKEERSNEEKKKRRFSFSSHFRRASRSRSRPSSVALPNNTPSVPGSTPETPPPRELHHYLMGERRPHSFHAPDSWVSTPPAALNEYFNTTPVRRSFSQSRLGILPSPAKSAFLNQEKDTEDDVPPIPLIPNDVAIKHYRRRPSQDRASHCMLHSVIRHSTPSITPDRHSISATITKYPKKYDNLPVLADDSNSQHISGAQQRAEDYKILLRAPEGSFQPDLPTAESDDLGRDVFHFGFNEQEPKIDRHGEVDDEDQPPQLDHDSLPTSSQLGQQAPPIYTIKHMDVSDEDSDREPIRGRTIAPLTTLNAKHDSDSISQVRPPAGKYSGAASNKKQEVGYIKRHEELRGARIIGYEDTPFVLARMPPVDFAATLGSQRNLHGSAKHSPFSTGHGVFTHGGFPDPPHHRINEERLIDQRECASNVQSATLSLLGDSFRTGKVRSVSSSEAEISAAGGATLASDAFSDCKDGQPTPGIEQTDTERAFSPVWFAKSDLQLSTTGTRDPGVVDGSTQVRAITSAEEHDQNARGLANPSPRAVGEIAAPAQQEIPLSHTLAGASAVAARSDTSTRSAPPSLVIDAIERHTASDSFDTLWHHEHNIIDSRDAGGDSDKMRNESSLAAPIGQVPRITQNGPETSKAEEPHNDDSQPATSNSFPDFKYQAQQLQVSKNATTAPERSRSVLSQISAMVSEEESNACSQTSTGRSTPSTIRRMQPDSTLKSSRAAPRIPEEISMSYGENDDFDLYADHNGIVKDLQDESGHPLRVGDHQIPARTPQQQIPWPSTSGYGTTPAFRDEERPRYSFERPMSFISGSEDQDGKPQDQINQAATQNAMQATSIPEQHWNQSQQLLQMRTVYTLNPPANLALPSDLSALRHQPMATSNSALSKNIFQAVKSINPGSKPTQAIISSWQPSDEATSEQGLPQGDDINRQPPQATQVRVPAGQQDYLTTLGQSVSQSNLNRPQGQMVFHEIQTRDQTHGPRNHFEYEQQLLQRQRQYLRHPNVESKPPATPSYHSAEQASVDQENMSSKLRLSSMFKKIGGKAQANSQHAPSTSDTPMSSHAKPLPPTPISSAPFHSVKERFTRPREASAERPVEQPRLFMPPSRPNMGQPQQFSEDLLKAKQAILHLDPRKPIASSHMDGLPSQQPPSIPDIQTQVHQAQHSGTPDPGKKKRFSTLGALFNRGGMNGDGSATKFKLSKEGKKTQKTQQSAAVLLAGIPTPQQLPQSEAHKSQQYSLSYYPPGQLPPHVVQDRPLRAPEFGPSQPAPNVYPQRPSQSYHQVQQMPLLREPISNPRSDEASAFLNTKQLAMEHQARQSSLQLRQSQAHPGIGVQSSSVSFESDPPHLRHSDSGRPHGGCHNPRADRAPAECGAYATSSVARRQSEQRKQHHTPQQGVRAVSHAEGPQTQHEMQQPGYGQHVHSDPRHEQQLERQTHPEPSPEQVAHQIWLAQREQLRRQEQSTPGRDELWPNADPWVQQPPQQQQNHPLKQQRPNDSKLPYQNAHDLGIHHSSRHAIPISLPILSPIQEPRYEAPPIPAAYSYVSGAFISPLDRKPQPLLPTQMNASMQVSPDSHDRPFPEPGMGILSQQASTQSQLLLDGTSHAGTSTMSLVSPISDPPSILHLHPTLGSQRHHTPRMSSKSELHQQDRPWHLNFPEGATGQEIVRARQGQYIQERFTAQQQQQAERAVASPSPRASPEQTAPTTAPPHSQTHGRGFREIFPRNTALSYKTSQAAQSGHDLQSIFRRDATPVQPTPIRSGQSLPAATYPLPMSPDPTMPNNRFNPVASGSNPPPPPGISHGPMRPEFLSTQPVSFGDHQSHSDSSSSPDHQYALPQRDVSQYGEQVPDEAPPSYGGPGVPDDGMDKSRSEALRPPNIETDLEDISRVRKPGSRLRQSSIGILEHPQPASMAASPKRTSPDMGAESLRRQLLQQENLAHMVRVQREKEQHERHERDRQGREAARARARELQCSASGGGQVGSLRSISGSTTGGAPGWEILRSHSNSRPVFELPAVEDDEPTMKATSYPGQEWVPPMWDGD